VNTSDGTGAGHLQTFADDSFGKARRDCGNLAIHGSRYDTQAIYEVELQAKS